MLTNFSNHCRKISHHQKSRFDIGLMRLTYLYHIILYINVVFQRNGFQDRDKDTSNQTAPAIRYGITSRQLSQDLRISPLFSLDEILDFG